jgi:hypothetical protein
MEILYRFMVWVLSPIAFVFGLCVYTSTQVEEFKDAFKQQTETIGLQEDLLGSYLEQTVELRARCAQLREQLTRARVQQLGVRYRRRVCEGNAPDLALYVCLDLTPNCCVATQRRRH